MPVVLFPANIMQKSISPTFRTIPIPICRSDSFPAIYRKPPVFPDIVEIAVSTRPDCIAPPYLEVLDRIRKEFGVQITIELGLQTANYHTLLSINRGHTLAELIDAGSYDPSLWI